MVVFYELCRSGVIKSVSDGMVNRQNEILQGLIGLKASYIQALFLSVFKRNRSAMGLEPRKVSEPCCNRFCLLVVSIEHV